MLWDKAGKLCKRLENWGDTYKAIRLDHAFSAFTGSVISEICCETDEDFLDQPGFASHW